MTIDVKDFPLLEWYREAKLVVLTNGDRKEQDQLFNNDRQYTETYSFNWKCSKPVQYS